MRFMNTYEIDEANQRYGNHPILGPAVRTLANLEVWTNKHSDGWAYWPKPARAAERLMALIEGDDHPEGRHHARFDLEREDATPEKLKAALRPIKSFRTRYNSRPQGWGVREGDTANFVICETLADVRAQDAENDDLKRRSHIALGQAIADEYGVTLAPKGGA